MSNIRQVFDKNENVVYEYKSLSGDVDYERLAEQYDLPLLDVDYDDNYRLVAIIEEIRCNSCQGSGKGNYAATGRREYWCSRCGGSGTRMRSYDPKVSEIVERWRSQMTRGGAFNDLYWEGPRARA